MRQSKLSPVVPHIGDALLVESHDITDLCFLAEDLKGLSDLQAAALLACLHSMGVMRSRSLALLAWLYKKRSGNPNPSAAYAFIFGHPIMMAKTDAMMDDVIRHMMTGRDKEDAGSVGGFSTRELQFIANLAWALRTEDPARSIEDACAKLEAEQTDALPLSHPDGTAAIFAYAPGDIVVIARHNNFIERIAKVSYVGLDGGIWAFTYSDYPTGVKERFAPELVRPATDAEVVSLIGFKDPQFPYPPVTANSEVSFSIAPKVTHELSFENTHGDEFFVSDLREALKGSSIRGAARTLGVADSTLRSWIKKAGL